MFNPNSIELPGGLDDDAEDEVIQVVPDKGLPTHDDQKGDIRRPQTVQRPEDATVRARVEELRKLRKSIEDGERKMHEQKAADRELKAALKPEQRTKKMHEIMAIITERQQAAKLPVGINCRINMVDFISVPNYGESVYAKDSRDISMFDEKFESSESGLKRIKIGEKMEEVTVALFNKYLPDLICTRTTKIDDYVNGVDTVLLLNGAVVAVFDEFIRETGKGDVRAEKKIENNKETNQKGGARLKYCFQKNDNEVLLGPEINIPLFTLSLDGDLMDRAIDNFSLDGPQNDAEKCAMYHFIDSIYRQIDRINKDMEENKIEFEPLFDVKDDYVRRLNLLGDFLEEKLSRVEVEKYLEEQIEKSKGKTKSPHKRKITRIR